MCRYDAKREVAVAQLVELRVVGPVAAGSSPVRHPLYDAAGRELRGALGDDAEDRGLLPFSGDLALDVVLAGGLREVVALGEVATQLQQLLELLDPLDAFGHRA